MSCFHPLHGWRSRVLLPSGKRGIEFNPHFGFPEFPVVVPCGQCVGCRLERSRQWAVRCMHEASLSDANCFITLTYSDAFLPPYGSLDRRAFPLFMKRLRKRFGKVRYFHAGEYGSTYGRPHYHACLFGFDFPDKVPVMRRGGFLVYDSPALRELWPFGRVEIGSVTFESAAYVARYIMEKVTGADAEVAYGFVDEDGVFRQMEPEYTTMSRRPGVGVPWLRKFAAEVYPSDGVVVRGRLMKPPRLYDTLYELDDPIGSGCVKAARRKALRARGVPTWDRLAVEEQCTMARLTLKKRGLQ